MPKTILYILGTSFSGSSLLNSLMDAQPYTRGLGEAVHLIAKPTSAWCSNCRCPVDQCWLQSRIAPDAFYESVFDAYPDAQVLVNSSKNWGLCFRHMPTPPKEYRIRLIVLSKSPEEFACSFSAHQDCSYEESLDVWVKAYEFLLLNLDGVLSPSPAPELQRRLASRVYEPDIAFVTYKQLASQPDETVKELCTKLDLPFSPRHRESLWTGDTCTIGGNNAIFAQRSQNASFFRADRDYLNGKYQGRMGSVFYDDAWRRDPSVKRAVEQYFDSCSHDVRLMRQRLGHCSDTINASTVITP